MVLPWAAGGCGSSGRRGVRVDGQQGEQNGGGGFMRGTWSGTGQLAGGELTAAAKTTAKSVAPLFLDRGGR